MGLFNKKETGDSRLEALQAEYLNYRRRTALELDATHARSARQTVLPFLALYDDICRALKAPCADEEYRKGIELIYKNLLATMAGLKIVPMDSKGKIFNPTYHEAVDRITDPALREEEIAQVVQTGFLMDEEVLRHAKVIVANCL